MTHDAWTSNDAGVCDVVAHRGDLATLQWARGNGCDWVNTAILAAAEGHWQCCSSSDPMGATETSASRSTKHPVMQEWIKTQLEWENRPE